MSLYAAFALLAAMVGLALGIAVCARSPEHSLNRLFGALCLLTAFSSLLEFGLRIAESRRMALFWWRLDFIWPLVLALGLHFVLSFTEKRSLLRRWWVLSLTYLPALALASLELFTTFLSDLPVLMPWGWAHGQPAVSLVLYLAVGWISAVGLLCPALVFHYWRTTPDRIRRNQAKYLLAGLALPFLTGLLTEVALPLAGIVIPPLTTAAVALGCFFMGYGTWRYGMFALTPRGAVESIVSTMPDALMLVDRSGRISWANVAAGKLLGLKCEELVGRPMDSIFPREQTSRPRFGLSGAGAVLTCERTRDIEATFRSASGQHVPVSISVAELRSRVSGLAMGTVCIARDITERRRAEEELRQHREHLEELVQARTAQLAESNARYAELFEDSPVPLWLLDLFGISTCLADLQQQEGAHLCVQHIEVLELNKAALTLMQADSKEDLLGSGKLPLPPQAQADLARAVVAFLGEGKLQEVEMTVQTLRGETRHVSARLSAVARSSGTPRRALLSTVDLTVRRRTEEEKAQLEEQLVQAQKLDALGKLAGGVAHDMNNILAVVMGMASAMQREIDAQQRAFNDLQTILAACDRGAELTGKLLGFARKGPRRREVVSLNRIVREMERLLARTLPKGIVVRTELDPSLAHLEGDPDHLHHIILNLALNAVDAMGERGTLSLTTENVDLGPAEVEKRPGLVPGRYARLCVQDSGSGMDAQTAARVFDPFFSTKPRTKGAGLGLSLVYGAVTGHRGHVGLKSEPGQGTTVTIHLPAKDSELTVTPAPGREGQALPAGNGTLLIVDDEELMLRSARRLLEQLGYNVLSAQSGEEALRLYQEQRGEISFVILDVVMPGMDGVETYHRLMEIDPDVRVIFSSGYTEETRTKKLLALKSRGFLHKPYNLEDLSAELVRAQV